MVYKLDACGLSALQFEPLDQRQSEMVAAKHGRHVSGWCQGNSCCDTCPSAAHPAALVGRPPSEMQRQQGALTTPMPADCERWCASSMHSAFGVVRHSTRARRRALNELARSRQPTVSLDALHGAQRSSVGASKRSRLLELAAHNPTAWARMLPPAASGLGCTPPGALCCLPLPQALWDNAVLGSNG